VAETRTRWRTVDPLRPGDPREVAGFHVVGRLGAGGMGVVYLADHPEHGPAALKFVRAGGPAAADPAFRARFGREVEAARRVRSPRVARVLAADPDATVPWLATAFVDGPTLQEAVEAEGPMSGDRLVALAVALADALAAVHEAGVVHRDLKPRNILLTPETPVLIDFGIASVREAPQLTRAGAALGTPGWMAPEQARGQRCGPATDVFAWGAVLAFAAGGRAPFGEGSADVLLYRIVHEPPDVPPLPPALDGLVRAALEKDPDRRPTVGQILAALTGAPLEETRPGDTALGPTVADRTAVVPTVVALGWDVEALPTRPDGRPRHVPAGVAVGRPRRPDGRSAPPPDAAFWYAGEDHRDPRTLAAAFQTLWADAVEQVFRRRDTVWIDELRGFLRAHGCDEAERLVAAGAGDTPPGAAMARLLLALDPALEPRVGAVRLTRDGLVAAAEAVVAGGEPSGPMRARTEGERRWQQLAEQLAEVGSARILRLWRGLPGMEGAAAIDERWHAWTQEFGRLVARIAPQAGWPSPEESRRASARLLLCAVDPEHERRLDRELAAARRTAARRQLWWAQVAAEGQRNPPAAVLAIMTADRARAVERERRAAARDQRGAERARRAADRPPAPPAPPAPPPAPAPPELRFAPLRRAWSSAASGWALALSLVGLVLYVWAEDALGTRLEIHHRLRVAAGLDRQGILGFTDAVRGATGAAVLLIALLIGAHMLTRVLLRQGTTRLGVRAYAVGAALVDLLLGYVFVIASLFGLLVVRAGADGATATATEPPFGQEPWGAAGLLLPYGLAGAWLAVRAAWRLGRAVLGGTVAMPFTPAPAVPAGYGR